MSWIFKLRGEVPAKWQWPLGILGVSSLLVVWIAITSGSQPVVMPSVLPHPLKVLAAYKELYSENNLIQNMFLSIGFNLAGYVKAILITIPVGFIIALYPLFRAMYQKTIDAVRFVPLAATTGLFIVWFGIGTAMKVNFLAFGILIFLLPVVVQRINEVKDVYLKTVYTIGATDWQTIKSVYFPSVLSRLIDDIRVLTAISWTYIVVAEGIGSQGGIGAMIFRVGQRQGRVDKTFAVLILIILIGIIQDRLFVRIDKELFPFKYLSNQRLGLIRTAGSIWTSVKDFALLALGWILVFGYLFLIVNELTGFLGISVFRYFFGDTAWAVHLVLLSAVLYKMRKTYTDYRQLLFKRKIENNGALS